MLESAPPAQAASAAPARPDWGRIDVVCLDMDGTLLDLHFDNHFWLEALPRRYAERHGLSLAATRERLRPRFEAKRGTLDWYCIDHWSEELGLDVAALKHELRAGIRWLPGAAEFLARVRAPGRRVLLTTNAHPISLAIKDAGAGLAPHFDALVSAHEFGVPKESAEFWPRFAAAHALDLQRTLFVDDSPGVLAAARAAGVAQVFRVLQPDSTQPPHAWDGHPGVGALLELAPSPT